LPGVDLEVEAHKAEEFEKDCEEFQSTLSKATPGNDIILTRLFS
jgi:hypothetical protein